MKIMTFNILTGGIDEDGSRIDLVKEAIIEASPDFVALQEANDFEKDDSKLLRELSQYIGLQYYALSPGAIYENGKQYHVASLSRYPLKKTYLFSGPSFQCAALFAVIDSPLGELSICNMHLHWGRVHAEEVRLKELEIILRHMSKHKNQILLGDFNSVSSDDYHDVERLEIEPRFDVTNTVKQQYVDVASHLELDNRSTFPTPFHKRAVLIGPRRVDYIFVAASLAEHITGASVIKTQVTDRASDHYPFIVTIE